MPTSIVGKRQNNARGFTYVMVLVAVVVLGILVEAATTVTSHIAQVDREAELLFRGQAYQRAIKIYYNVAKSFPRLLEDLVMDPRSQNRRHIRALYPDPMAKGEKKEWLLIRASDGGIAGVASNSNDEPLKRANFPKELKKFDAAKAYSDWIFEYVPQRIGTVPGVPTPPNPTSPPVLKTF